MEFKHPPESKFLEVPRGRLHYLEWALRQSPCILLLHGFTSHAHCWDPLADTLCQEYRVLALDLRGHGDSSWSRNGYSNAVFVEDLRALFAALELERLSLLGMSLGGLNAMSYAASHPERVERLILVDIGPELPTNGRPREIFSLFTGRSTFSSPEEAYQFRRTQDTRPDPELECYLTYHAVRQRPDGRWAWKYDPLFRSPWRLLLMGTPLRWLSGLEPPNLWPVLPKITCPTLILRGEESPVLSAPVAQEMQRRLPDARLVTIRGCGHRIHIERPREFEATVLEFLRSAHPTGARQG